MPDCFFLEAKTPAGCHPKGLHQHWIAKRSREEREIFEHRSRPALIARMRAKEVTRGLARGADSRLWRLAEGGYGRGRWKRGGRASPPLCTGLNWPIRSTVLVSSRPRKIGGPRAGGKRGTTFPSKPKAPGAGHAFRRV